MALDDKLWIFGYKMGSKSALALAEAMDIYMIRHENSEWRGREGRFILNWGAGTGVFTPKVGKAIVFNKPELVDLAVNKLEFFRAMEGKDAPRVPFWTRSAATAQGWLAAGYTIIGRKVLEGMKGKGLVVMKKPLDFSECALYTVKVDAQAEYRTYMFDGEVIDARIKLLGEGQTADPDNMRYDEKKYEFCRLGTRTLPEDVKEQSRRCIKKLGLFTGGVDVLWTGERAVVLEVNTAPYVGDRTAAKYAQCFERYLANNG